ncbi:MAG: hypothetical protein ACE5FG_13710 [Myxococcota bacterium]
MERSLSAAAAYLAAFSQAQLRFDAAVGLHEMRKTVDSERLRRAMARALEVSNRDHDNPMRRFWDPEMAVPAGILHAWIPPQDGTRVNPNRVTSEALHCDRSGMREESLAYLSGPMRDAGGYQSVHALWALVLAHERGCVEGRTYETSLRSLQRELVEHQPATFTPTRTLDIDLYAERVLMLLQSGYTAPVVDAWVERLLELQREDGRWGVDDPGLDPYFQYHTTLACSWAVTEWVRRVLAHPDLRYAPR